MADEPTIDFEPSEIPEALAVLRDALVLGYKALAGIREREGQLPPGIYFFMSDEEQKRFVGYMSEDIHEYR